MQTHKEFKAWTLEVPAVRTEYEHLQPEMERLDILLYAREEAGLTQSEVALRKGSSLSPRRWKRLMWRK